MYRRNGIYLKDERLCDGGVNSVIWVGWSNCRRPSTVSATELPVQIAAKSTKNQHLLMCWLLMFLDYIV